MSTQSLSNDSSDAPLENTIADLVGLEVYTTSGVYIGTVEDTRLDFAQQQTTGLALTDLNHEVFGGHVDARSSRGIVIPFRWVRSAHDIVLIMDIVDRLSAAGEASE